MMPELGQVRNLDGQCHVFMRCYSHRYRNGISLQWVNVDQFGLPDLQAALHLVPNGAVIDLDAMARREVIVLSAPAVALVLDDDTLDALLAEAEATGIRLEGGSDGE